MNQLHTEWQKAESFLSKIWKKKRISTSTTSFNTVLEVLARSIQQEK
jgi:hypothetical protein